MSKSMFIPPMLTNVGDSTDINIHPSGGLIAQAFDEPAEVTVTMPDGSVIVADEFGNILEEAVESVEAVEEIVVE